MNNPTDQKINGRKTGTKLVAGILVILIIVWVLVYLKNNQNIETMEQQRIEMITGHLQNAKTSWQTGSFETTVSEANKALNIAISDDEKAGAYYWRGVGFYRLGDLEKAEADEDLAIQLAPNFAGPYVTLSAVYWAKGMKKESEAMAHKSIEVDPTYAWGYNSLGVIYLQQGNFKEGIELLKKAIEIDPNQPMFANNLRMAEEEARKVENK